MAWKQGDYQKGTKRLLGAVSAMWLAMLTLNWEEQADCRFKKFEVWKVKPLTASIRMLVRV
jgi:hypothetical protein